MTTTHFYTDDADDDADETGLGVVEDDDDNMLLQGFMWGCGIRFPNVTIPKSATIVSASLLLRLKLLSCAATGNCSNSVKGEDADNAAVFDETNSEDISDRTPTTAAVGWNEDSNAAVNGYPTASINVKSIVEEITTRAGWSSGNAMAFLINTASYGKTTSIQIWSNEGGDSVRPHLLVTYSVGRRIYTTIC